MSIEDVEFIRKKINQYKTSVIVNAVGITKDAINKFKCGKTETPQFLTIMAMQKFLLKEAHEISITLGE